MLYHLFRCTGRSVKEEGNVLFLLLAFVQTRTRKRDEDDEHSTDCAVHETSRINDLISLLIHSSCCEATLNENRTQFIDAINNLIAVTFCKGLIFFPISLSVVRVARYADMV